MDEKMIPETSAHDGGTVPSPSLRVSAAPHVKHPDTVQSIMLDVMVALVPAAVWGVYCFGLRVRHGFFATVPFHLRR